jgi:hypothetical protein
MKGEAARGRPLLLAAAGVASRQEVTAENAPSLRSHERAPRENHVTVRAERLTLPEFRVREMGR